MKTRLLLTALAALAALEVGRAAAEVRGGKDHPLIKRYEGSLILGYTTKDFDEYTLPLGPSTGIGNGTRLTKSEHLEGGLTRITYLAPEGRSTLEVFRNFETELKAAGYEMLFSGAGEALSANFAYASGLKDVSLPGIGGTSLFTLDTRSHRFLAARRRRAEGDVHVALYVGAIPDNMVNFISIEPGKPGPNPAAGQVVYQIDVVISKPMDTGMVAVAAGEMAAGISSTGSVALYGILFDTNSAEIQPASTPTLQEIGKLLKSQPALKLLVVGHTDNVGSFEANLDLSQRRAASVVKALTGLHGVSASRLVPVGVSFAAPVAPNKTDEGRTRNRRVQLVER
jgi:outer membrane protein OmpA-like peptidoglycan-associated protein